MYGGCQRASPIIDESSTYWICSGDCNYHLCALCYEDLKKIRRQQRLYMIKFSKDNTFDFHYFPHSQIDYHGSRLNFQSNINEQDIQSIFNNFFNINNSNSELINNDNNDHNKNTDYNKTNKSKYFITIF